MNTSPIERILKIDMVEATANGSIDIEAKHRAGVAADGGRRPRLPLLAAAPVSHTVF